MTQPIDPPVTVSPVLSTVTVKRRSGGGGNVALLLAGIVAAGGIAFATGRATAPASSADILAGGNAAAAGVPAGQPGQLPTGSFAPYGSFAPGAGGAVGFGGAMSIEGTVTKIDGTTLTLKTATGQTVTVDLAGATYHTQQTATAVVVTAGTSVQVSLTGMGGLRGGAAASPAAGGATATATDITILTK